MISRRTSQTMLILITLVTATIITLLAQAPSTYAADSAIRVVPATLEFGPANATGQEFTIDVNIENVTNFYGLDLQFAWDTEYLAYVSHTMTIPADDYPDGVLWEPGISVKDDVDEVAGTYWVSYASMDPAPSFDGTGKAFNMTFMIIKHPWELYEPDAVMDFRFTYTALSDKPGDPLPGGWDVYDGTVILHKIPYVYPPKPMLKIMPETAQPPTGTQFTSDVYVMAEDETDLDPFWDVGGFDVWMHFSRSAAPYIIMEAIDVTIDPDGTFTAFWPGGIIKLVEDFDNTAGTVHVAFLGIPDIDTSNHTPPEGTFRIFTVTFNATYAGPPDLSVDITLKNPTLFIHQATPDADSGLIDLASPVGELWTMVNPDDYGTNVELTRWVDADFDGELSAGDKIMLNDTTSDFWHEYVVNDLAGTLEMTQQPFQLTQEFTVVDGIPDVWDKPVVADTGTYNDKDGNPYWTGNFSLSYDVSSVNSIHVTPPFSAPYDLVEGTDFIVHTGTPNVELLTPLDEQVINEYYIAGINGTPAGWPGIEHMASGFQSIWVDFNNGTSRWARNLGFETGPPNEYWYEGDWPNEIEGWWALDFGANITENPEAWPVGTQYWINYTVPADILVDYNAVPDPTPYIVEYDGTYTDFLALSDPTNTNWTETYAWPFRTHNCVGWSDEDTSGDLTVGDIITLEDNTRNSITAPYIIDKIATDIIVDQIGCICSVDPNDPFYCNEIIVGVAGFPHQDRALCPWHYSDSAIPLPHDVENAQVTIPEFPGSSALVLSLIAATIAVALAKKKSTKTKNVPLSI
ncbi:MAG: cohesin domain-containing protein [Candidatus Bathyarchaeota archaeon]|nr:cohesin domain-containing protein [Candidatus Bathyarchaeota archaeon]